MGKGRKPLRSVLMGLFSRLCLLLGLILLVPAMVGVYYGENIVALKSFMVPSVTLALLGYVASRRWPLAEEISVPQALIFSALSWLLVAGIGALPFTLGGVLGPLDSYFEAMSGFTATGMTLIPKLENLPRSILFWRALTQWLGGGGVVLFFILLIAPKGVGVWRLYVAEAREERLTVKAWDTVRDIWLIYVAYTALCALLLVMVGLSSFDAICHAFTALATGGFSTRSLNIEAFHSSAVEAVLAVFMVIGAINFHVHLMVLRGRVKEALSNIELRAMLAILAASTIMVTLDLVFNGHLPLAKALRLAYFQVASISTTTGYTSFDVNLLPEASKWILMCLMLVGGCLCSTAGGVKVARAVILAKLVRLETLKTLLPREAVTSLKVGGRVIEKEDLLRIACFFALYLAIAAAAALILTHQNLSFTSALSAALSAEGGVGPAFIDLLKLDAASKLTLIACMWMGRLELTPVLSLLTTQAWERAL